MEGAQVEATPSWHAAHRPEAPALVLGRSGETTTFAQLEDRSTRLARALRERGLPPAGHIAVLMENNRPYLEILWAAQRSGLHYTAINSHLRSAEVQYVLDDCGATALLSSAAMADVVARLDLARIPIRISAVGDLDGFERYDEILAATAPGPLEDEQEGREMLYSSGTTGRPKGVRKALPRTPFGDPASAPVQIAQGVAATGAGPGSVYLSPAPLYHAAPLVYSMSMQRLGGTVVVMERFDPQECLELIERHRVTHAQFVPTMFVRMLKLPEEVRARYDVSSLKVALHAAAPCPVPIKRRMIEWWGPILQEYYAGTEDIGSTFITSQEWLAHPGSVGRPSEACYIVGEDGEVLPPGQVGVIYFDGGRPFEYHNDPEKTASIRNDRGWRTLNDVGYLDEDGYLYLTDRKAHMIISGGVNIYPQEAENVLVAHPAVADVAVIGVPDDDMGESVKAVVQLVEPSQAGSALAEELLSYCRSELATYKCPRSIEFAEKLPRDDNGKLYKRLLRERYWAGHESLIR
jgi:long-chain acyl-CoA synthetase